MEVFKITCSNQLCLLLSSMPRLFGNVLYDLKTESYKISPFINPFEHLIY